MSVNAKVCMSELQNIDNLSTSYKKLNVNSYLPCIFYWFLLKHNTAFPNKSLNYTGKTRLCFFLHVKIWKYLLYSHKSKDITMEKEKVKITLLEIIIGCDQWIVRPFLSYLLTSFSKSGLTYMKYSFCNTK